MDMKELAQVFGREFGYHPEVGVEAPGRVNVIGEHTDYNAGFVLPAAIDRRISIQAARRDDSKVRAYSLDFSEYSEFQTDSISRVEEAKWSNYLRGVVLQFQKAGYQVPGLDLVVSGDVPIGSGLSSSAAFEVAVAETVRVLGNIDLDKVRMALMCQAAENEFVGVNCGIMDQFVSALAVEGAALFIDCRDLSYRTVPLGKGVSLVVCDTKVARRLEVSEYNERRLECENAAAKLNSELGGIMALRDVSFQELEANRAVLSEREYRRARHVVGENERVLAGIEVLAGGDLNCFGRMLFQSHESLKNDYEVSSPELDTLVDLAREAPGIIGGRMTGAGFGGCTVNLVREESVDDFCAFVGPEYQRRTGTAGEIYVCQPSSGVRSWKNS